MTEISIPFNKWSQDRLKSKVKLATTRNKRYGKIKDTFIINFWNDDKVITESYKFELLAVFQLSLYDVGTQLYFIEGAESPSDFRKVWEDIYPKAGWQPDKKVYVHLFRLIEVL